MVGQNSGESAGDVLSPLARELAALKPEAAYTRLVVGDAGDEQARQMLEAVSPEKLVVGRVVSLPDAQALLSALWLWHDWLDQSHTISQAIHTPTGSYWHAILHRREGDFSNAKYWYARCANHPVLPSLARVAAGVVHPLPADKTFLRLIRDGWDSDVFVDLCEELHKRPDDPRHSIAVRLQQIEWRILFDDWRAGLLENRGCANYYAIGTEWRYAHPCCR